MKRMLLSLGLFATTLTFISATNKVTAKAGECYTNYRYISRFQCGDTLDGEFLVPPPGPEPGPPSCIVNVDFITNYNDSIPVCWHMHPPGGRY